MTNIKRKRPGLQSIGRFIFGIERKSRANIKKILNEYQFERVLIVGSAEVGAGCDLIYSMDNVEIVGVDIYESPTVTELCDAHDMPFKDGVFDLVVCQAVLEHVKTPPIVVSEIYRVLRKGGMVYSEVPFMQPVHEFPHDYLRYTVEGHLQLYNIFHVTDYGVNGGYFNAMAWCFRYFMQSIIHTKIGAILISAPVFLVAKIFEMLINSENNILYTGSYLVATKR